MDRPLFVYGTLSDPDLLSAVLGRPVPAALRPAAVAPGFVALSDRRGEEAVLVRAPGGAASGLVILGLSAFEADLLDAFAGERFSRGIVPVMLDEELHEADAHLATWPVARETEPWSLLRWQGRHKSRMLPAGKAAAADLRARLLAIRPN